MEHYNIASIAEREIFHYTLWEKLLHSKDPGWKCACPAIFPNWVLKKKS